MEDSPFIYIWYMRVAKSFCVTRDGPKICRVTHNWTQIVPVTRDQTSQRDAWFAILQACDAYVQNVLISEYIAL